MSRSAGYVLIGAGIVVIVLGSIGLAASNEEGPAAGVGPSAATGATVTTGATGVTAATGQTGPTASGSVEVGSPEAFLAAFGQAIREGDAGYLFERLHPAVLALYGQEQCQAQVEAFSDPNANFTFLSASPPQTFAWEVDGQTIPVEDVLNVRVEFLRGNGPARRTIHLGVVDGELRWFTDCGDPV